MSTERISLFKHETSSIKISIEIYFNDEEQLIFDGYDVGKSVNDCWGDSDYEYQYTIEPNEVQKLYLVLEVGMSDKLALLHEIKSRFEGNEAYSKFGEFMNTHHIEYSASTWA